MLKVLLFVVCAAISNPKDYEARLAKVRSDYDLEAAQALVSELRPLMPSGPSLEERYLFGRALLYAAELERMEFEETRDQVERSRKREMGRSIDALADEGLAQATAMGETSESYRLRSDFIALKIRTKYQGSKYHEEMEEAAAKALELDPKNANAYVSVCRPFLFAKPNQGGDVQKALDLLSKAVSLDPNLEIAQFFLAIAYQKMGDQAKADQILKDILARNPKCKLAMETFEKAQQAVEDEDGKGGNGE